MGFSFRKSVKIGPIRLNASKSGIGISGGVNGAEIANPEFFFLWECTKAPTILNSRHFMKIIITS